MNPTIPIQARELVFSDCETSSLDPSTGEILEFAAVRITPDLQTVKASMERKCQMRFPERASPEALKVNGYDPQLWAHKSEHIRITLIDFAKMLDEDVVLGGHEHAL